MDTAAGFLGQLGAIALVGAFVGALVFLFRTWIASKIQQSIKHSFDLSLEQFKGEIELNTAQYVSMQSAGNAAMVEGQRVAAERRIKAAERLWKEFNRLQTELSEIATLLDFYRVSENQSFSTNPLLPTYIENFDIRQIFTSSNDLSKARPYVGESLYATVFSYRIILGRIVVLTRQGLKVGQIPIWYEDKRILDVLRASLTAEDMDRFEGLEFGQHVIWINHLYDLQILEELREIIAGTHSMEEGLDQAKKVLEVAQETEAESKKRREGTFDS